MCQVCLIDCWRNRLDLRREVRAGESDGDRQTERHIDRDKETEIETDRHIESEIHTEIMINSF